MFINIIISVQILLLLFLLIWSLFRYKIGFQNLFFSGAVFSAAIFIASIGCFRISWNIELAENAVSPSFSFFLLFLFLLGVIGVKKDILSGLKRSFVSILIFSGICLAFLLLTLFFDLKVIRFVENTELGRVLIFIKSGKYFLIAMLLLLVLTIYNYEAVYRNLKKRNSNLPVRRLYAVFLGMMLFPLYGLSYSILYSRISLAFLSASSVVAFIACCIVLLTLLKHKIRAENIQVDREVIYSSGTFIFIGLYFIIISVVSKILSIFHIGLNTFFSVLAAVGVIMGFFAILLSASLKQRIKNFMDRNFYKGAIDYRQLWHEFNNRIASILELPELLKTIRHTIKEKLSVSDVKIFLSLNSNHVFSTLEEPHIDSITVSQFGKEWMLRNGKSMDQEDQKIPESIKAIFSKCSPSTSKRWVVSPLIYQRELIGLLVCLRTNEREWKFRDYELLDTLANESAIAIHNLKLSQDLVEAKKLESFHRFSSFIVHDMKNLASRLTLVVENARVNLNNPGFQKDMMQTLTSTISEMSELMDRIHISMDGNQPNFRLISPRKILHQVIEDLRLNQNSRIQLTVSGSKSEPEIQVDPEQIYKVLLNLALNAIEAMPEGGELAIATSYDERYYRFVVRDTGVGMSQDFLKNKLFHPFETTKKKGLGVGLYQCKEIIEAHHGKITVDSETGRGTTFTAILPLSPSKSEEVAEVHSIHPNEHKALIP